MQLTLDQAVGQKLMLSFVGAQPPPDILALIEDQHIGGITLFRAKNVVDPAQVRDLTDSLQRAAAASGQPLLLMATDQEGGQLMAIGGMTPFPGNMALGATGSVELARQTGQALGRELAAMGVNVNYAPVCDVNSNPQNPVIGIRSFGEDPALVARLGAALVEGLQSSGVAATAKHFPGHGDTGSDPHFSLPSVFHDRQRLAEIEIPPFAAAIEAGVRLVMTTHLAFPNLNAGQAVPSTLSALLLQGMLRDELGFDGVIISDAMDMGAIRQGPGLVGNALAAAAAGVDLLLLVDEVAVYREIYSALLRSTERGSLSLDAMLSSSQRVLALKHWLADRPQPSLDVVGCPEHQSLAYQTAAHALTLVRDDARLLPLRPSSDARLAVLLPRSVDLTPADTSSYVTCRLAQAVRRYHPAVDEYVVSDAPSGADIAALRQQMTDYDGVILGTINAFAQPNQAAMVRAVLETGVPTIVVALRLPYDLQAFPGAPTYVCTYSILEPAMDALAKGLWGEIPMSGQLPVSIPQMYPVGHRMSV
jgi:beta-N-acetylhexosaminidase